MRRYRIKFVEDDSQRLRIFLVKDGHKSWNLRQKGESLETDSNKERKRTQRLKEEMIEKG